MAANDYNGGHSPPYETVKHGLADSPKAWKFSTFHRYVEAGLYPKDWGDTGLEIHLDGGE
jgi:putative transposase